MLYTLIIEAVVVVPKQLQTPETENGARNIASLEHRAVRSLSPPYQRIVQHSLSPHMSTSFGGYTTLCRSLTSSWSSLHSENNLYRPVPGTTPPFSVFVFK